MSSPSVGELLNQRYRLLAQLGEGSGGAVFRARDEQLGIDVAIKVLFDRGASSEEPLWMKEAEIALTLRHPGVVSGYALQSAETGFPYLVMELLPNGSLEQRVRTRGAFSLAETVATLEQLAEALAYMHSEGVLHRDIKPANILYSAEERPKLADFGIARAVERGGTVTRDVGTQNYAAPEQLAGYPEQRSDLFSLGAVGYFMLNGAPPPPAFDRVAFKRAVGFSVTSATPLWLQHLLRRCLERSPEQRPASVELFLQELRRGAQATGSSGRRLLVETVLIAALVGALFALQYTREAIDLIAQPVVVASRVSGIDLIGLVEGSGLRIGTRPLYVDAAIRRDDLASVRWLLESKPERISEQALLGYVCSATSNRRPEILRYLISRAASVDRVCNDEVRTPLGTAVKLRDSELIAILLGAGADPNIDRGESGSLLDELVDTCDPDLIRVFLTSAQGRIAQDRMAVPTAMRLVRRPCGEKSFEAFVQGGGAVNGQDERGNTVLHLLASMPTNPRLELLLSAKSLDVNIRNAAGSTALHQILSHREPEGFEPTRFERLVERFIALGADLNAVTDEGITPTMFAAMKHRAKILQLLLQSDRVNLDHVDHSGRGLEASVSSQEWELKRALIREARARMRE